MFGRKTETALADWPLTAVIEGGKGVHITGRYLHPALGATFDKALLIAFLPLSWIIIRLIGVYDVPHILFVPMGILAGGALAVKPIVEETVRHNVDIRIFPDALEVKTLFGNTRYLLDHVMEFRVEQHHKARQEAQREREKNKKQARTYRDALEVVMQYGEKRVVLAEMQNKEQEKARALQFRIQSWIEKLQGIPQFDVGGSSSAPLPQPGQFGPAPDIR